MGNRRQITCQIPSPTTSAAFSKVKEISWHGFDYIIALLSDKVPNTYKTWLMVGNGGFWVGNALYNSVISLYNKPRTAYIVASHYKGRRRKEEVVLSQILGDLKSPVLVIDDLSDTGDTFKAIKEVLDKKKIRADFASLFIKPWTRFTPKYYLWEEKEWIVFPWERDD